MKYFIASAIAAACVATTVSVAMADPDSQPEDRLRQGVLERDRPAYAAKGIRAGDFLLYPAIDITGAYDDNIYETRGNRTDDFSVLTRPQLKIESNLPRHAFWFRGDVLNGTYLNHSHENRTDYYVGGGSRIDIRHDLDWNTDIEYQKDTEDRGSPDANAAAADPVDFYRFQANSALRYRPGRFNLTGGGIFENYNFNNVDLIVPPGGCPNTNHNPNLPSAGACFQNNKDRNRNVYAGYGRIGYDVSPGYELFVLGMYSTTNYAQYYDDNVDATGHGLHRDSSGYDVEAGARFEITNVISGEATVGYVEREFHDFRLNNIDGISTGTKVNWYVTRLTTLHFDASRKVQETTLFGASGYLDTAFDIGVDHELMRNVILSANLRYDQWDYKGIDRTDKQYSPMFRALYMINRNLSVAGEYHYYDRSSTVPTEDYTRNLVLLTVRVQI